MPRPGSDRIVSRPPSASTRSRSRSSPAVGSGAVLDDLEGERSAPRPAPSIVAARRPRRARAPRGSRSTPPPRPRAGSSRPLRPRSEPGPRRSTAADAQRRSEAARLEQRRIDPLRELAPSRPAPAARRAPSPRGAPSPPQDRRPPTARELQVDGERDQVLLHAVVEVALDAAAVGIGGQDEPLPGRAQLLDLEAQPVERFLQRLDVPSLQGDRPPARGLRGSCPSSHRRRQAAQHAA